MNNSVISDKSNIYACTGCSVCAISCPTDAIKIILIEEGFYEPSIDEELCIECGLCKKSCYKFDEEILSKDEETCIFYSAINKDNEELKSTTSGGVSSELMKQCIIQGYKVLGVAYDYEEDISITKIASSNEELDQFKGSKYFQSYTMDAFYEALNDKTEQKYALFGTPCQIYAMSKYINAHRKKDKFLLIDIFCHGCPSLNLWTKYLDYSKNKFGVSQFNKIEFRSKAHGWHEFSTTFYNEKNRYVSSKTNDPFYTMFSDMNALNEACYTCEIRSTLGYTDIRLGDFWGYQYDLDTKGVSAVVLCSDQGKELFGKIKSKFKVYEHSFSETVAAQSYGKAHECNKELRDYTLELLSSDLNMEAVIKDYRKTFSVKKKLKIAIKNSMKRLPHKLYLNIKKIAHKM